MKFFNNDILISMHIVSQSTTIRNLINSVSEIHGTVRVCICFKHDNTATRWKTFKRKQFFLHYEERILLAHAEMCFWSAEKHVECSGSVIPTEKIAQTGSDMKC